ncbi:zinc finger protein 184-like [Cololabis saira]|uniref:zinc finger protein 184-like n=1 Tax=Cololabis saira TaxID=129043 RepID=UPI002AD4F929|nr:zinc finger protein 184-like [Cololabis saira]
MDNVTAMKALQLSAYERIKQATETVLLRLEDGADCGKMRLLLNEVLTTTVEEILRVFERTVVEYEERLLRSEQQVLQVCPQHRLLNSLFSPTVMLERADIQQLFPNKEEVSNKHLGRSSSMIPEETLSKEMQEEDKGCDCEGLDSDDDLTLAAEKLSDSLEQGGQNMSKDEKLTANAESDLGETHYTCSMCGERFAQLIGLSYHLKIHKSKKDRRMEGRKEFASRNSLRYHNLIHTGMRPFSCDNCNKRFRWPSQIRSHNCVSLSAITTSVKTDGPNYEGQKKPGCNSYTKPPSCPDNKVQTELRKCWQEQKTLASTIHKGDLSRHTALQTEVQNKVKQETAEPLHVKEEQEEKEIVNFTFCQVPVKVEEADETPQASQLLYIKAEENMGSVKEPEPGLPPHQHPTSNSSDTDVSDGEWEKLGQIQTALWTLR